MSADILSRADELCSDFEYSAAEKICREYLAEHPEDDIVWTKLGQVLRKTEDLTGACEACESAFDIQPEKHEYAENLGDTLALLHSFEEAQALFEKAAESGAGLYPRLRIGDMLFFRGKTAEAAKVMEKLAEEYPDEPDVYHRLYVIYGADKKKTAAENALDKEISFRKVRAEKTKGAAEYLLLGTVYLEKKTYGEVIAAAKKSLSVEESPDAYLLLGIAYAKDGRLSEAKEAFIKGISCEPKNLTFILEIADTLTELGFFDDAVSAYTKALELRNIRADTWASLAYALLMLGKKEEAQAFFEMAKASAAVRELKWADKLHKSDKTRALDEAFGNKH
ncbi:MAG: tetratricopeptide repeat protein [Methanocorpusculum sp.]|nr:tetratricopeptide repeat protein [Methanocorpusculum sp.]